MSNSRTIRFACAFAGSMNRALVVNIEKGFLNCYSNANCSMMTKELEMRGLAVIL